MVRCQEILFILAFLHPVTVVALGGPFEGGFAGGDVDAAYQSQLVAWQDIITNSSNFNSWEWVVIRINGAGGLEEADRFSAADTVVDVRALTPADAEPPVDFHENDELSHFVFGEQRANDDPEWFELGVVAYERSSATHLQVLFQDVELIRENQVLINATLDLPVDYDTWVDYSLQDGSYTLNISLWRSFTPMFTSQDQAAMNLTEVLFDLEDGSIASLVYKTNPSNDKAVLYLPGRADSFAHPHVLELYETRGYDFYSLDPRYCGRTRRFMNDIQYGHWIDDFDIYEEEIKYTLDFMKEQFNYSSIVAHCHSTGALLALNHAMLSEEEDPNQPEPFDGYILNGPFLDWGHVGGFLQEVLLENAALVEWALPNFLQATGLSLFHTRIWILYRYNTEWRPIIQAHMSAVWAQAATDVQRKITSRRTPITTNPVLLIASRGDNTLLASESEERMSSVASNYASVLLEHNSHDVTYSFTKQLNDDALAEISKWLDAFELSMD